MCVSKFQLHSVTCTTIAERYVQDSVPKALPNDTKQSRKQQQSSTSLATMEARAMAPHPMSPFTSAVPTLYHFWEPPLETLPPNFRGAYSRGQSLTQMRSAALVAPHHTLF